MNTHIDIGEYTYTLPPEKIALYPLSERAPAKLLVYRKGEIEHRYFGTLQNHLPANSLLFFNDTKVIPARLHFTKDTGAVIEVFLLHPMKPSTLLVETMQTSGRCTWKCTIGNLKRCSTGLPLTRPV